MMQRHSTLHVSLNMHLYTNYLKKNATKILKTQWLPFWIKLSWYLCNTVVVVYLVIADSCYGYSSSR